MFSTSHTSRRAALGRALSAAAAIAFGGALWAMLRRVARQRGPQPVAIPADVPLGLTVLGDVIVHRGGDGALRAYSARCTHLACRIDRIDGDEAVCPCHGSRFRADGSVATGPASRPLASVALEPDAATGGWIARGR
jgi:Rieske Fe-S protein